MIKKWSVFFPAAFRRQLEADPQLRKDPGLLAAIELVNTIVKHCLLGTAACLLPDLGRPLNQILNTGHEGFDELQFAFLNSARMEAYIRPIGNGAYVAEIKFYRRGEKEYFYHLRVTFDRSGTPATTGWEVTVQLMQTLAASREADVTL